MSNYVITFIASGNDLIDNIAITLTDKDPKCRSKAAYNIDTIYLHNVLNVVAVFIEQKIMMLDLILARRGPGKRRWPQTGLSSLSALEIATAAVRPRPQHWCCAAPPLLSSPETVNKSSRERGDTKQLAHEG